MKPQLVDYSLMKKKIVLTEYQEQKRKGKYISITINIVSAIFLILFFAWIYDIYLDHKKELKTPAEDLYRPTTNQMYYQADTHLPSNMYIPANSVY